MPYNVKSESTFVMMITNTLLDVKIDFIGHLRIDLIFSSLDLSAVA